MGKTVVVGISDLNVVKAGDTLITYALGSCVGICLYDPIHKIAGMSHIMLPTAQVTAAKGQELKYADTAIPILINKMMAAGALRSSLKAKIAGGAKMFATVGNNDISNIGDRNVAAVKATLAKNKIPILVADTGKDFGRTQKFDADTGTMNIKSAHKGEWSL